MVVLSNELVKALTASVTNNSSVERSDKDLFLLAYKEYKSVSKSSRGHITNLLNVKVGILTKSISVQNTLKRVFKVAFNYVDMSVICKFDSLEYTNITNLVKLFKYIDKHEEDKMTLIRDKVKAVYTDVLLSYEYNNEISKLITELKEEYKLKEQEGEFVFVDVVNYMRGQLSHMNEAQLLELLGLVQDKYDTIETVKEVA